jgi:hypothetical protein
MSKLVKKPVNGFDPIAWHDSPDGGARGVIAKGVSSPYIVDVMPDGRFDIFTLTKADKPRHVASGRANNLSTAKARATEKALANIPELKDGLQADIVVTTATPVQRLEQPAWLITLKVYVALALFVFAALIFARWLLIYRPALFIRGFSWVAASLFGAWRLMKFFDDLDKRRERLAKRKVLDAQAALASKKVGKR